MHRSISPGKIFLQKRFSHKGYPFMGRNHFWTVFGRGGMTKFSKWKVPPPGGQARRKKLLVSWGPLVIAAPLAGSLLAPLRRAAPCQFRWRAISPPSRYPHLSQAAFAPSVRSRCSPTGKGRSQARRRPGREARPAEGKIKKGGCPPPLRFWRTPPFGALAQQHNGWECALMVALAPACEAVRREEEGLVLDSTRTGGRVLSDGRVLICCR